MGNLKNKLVVTSLATSVSLLALSSAYAQTAEEVKLEKVVVETNAEEADGPVDGYVAKVSASGTKTGTLLDKTPQTISVVSSEAIEDREAVSVAESLRYTPGVVTEYRGASNLKDEMYIRGIGYAHRYLDGLFLGGQNSYGKIDPYLLERVEMIAGPASVLYGQANPGGLVNMVSKKPGNSTGNEVFIGVGTDNQVSAGFDVSGSFDENIWGWRLVGTGNMGDGQEDYVEEKNYSIAPSVTWSPNDQTSLTLLSGYRNDPDAGYRNFLEREGTLVPIAGVGFISTDFFVSDPNFEKATTEQGWVGYEFDHEFNEALSFHQNARFMAVNMMRDTLIWGSTSGSTLSRVASSGKDSWRSFGLDNQLIGKVSTGEADHTLMAGVDYRYLFRDYFWQRDSSGGSIDLSSPVYGTVDRSSLSLSTTYDQETTAHQVGLYLQDQIELGKLNLLGSVRYDIAETQIDDYLNSTHQDYSDQAFTWRAGAVYDLGYGFKPYASYATSFEPALAAAPAGSSAFDPVTAEQYEIGIKYVPDFINAAFSLAFYDLTQNGKIEYNYSTSQNEQIGEIHSRGLEFSANVELMKNLSLTGAYTYTDSEVTEAINTAKIGTTPHIPTHQASVWAKYDFDDGVFEGALDGLSVGAGVRYIGERQGIMYGSSGTNRFDVPHVTLFDAMVSYDFGKKFSSLEGVSLQVNAKNLADETYVSSCESQYSCFYGDRRSVFAKLKYTW